MVDTVNYANSPLTDANFFSDGPQGASVDFSKSPLTDTKFVDELAVTSRSKPKTVTVAEKETELRVQRASVQSRSADQVIQDTLVAAGSGFVGLVGSGLSLGTSAIGSGIQKLATDGSITDDIGGVVSAYGVELAQNSQEATSYINSFKSDPRQETANLTAQIGQLQSAENAQEEQDALANGDSAFIAGLSRVGKDVIDSGERILSDSSEVGDVVANALGSLGPSAAVAKTGVKIASNVAQRFGATGAALTVAETAGSAIGTGVIEGAGAYSSTVSEIMGYSQEEMMKSEGYRDLLAQGFSPENAQSQMADSAGQEAYGRQMPLAMAAGTLVGKFNANPLTAFKGKGMVDGLREVGLQTLEEGFQGGTGQLSQNQAIQNQIDPTKSLAEGVGEQIATGAIGGAGMAGVLAGPGVVQQTLGEQRASVEDQVRNERAVKGMGEQIAAQRARDEIRRNPDAALKSTFTKPETAAEMLFRKTGETVSTGIDLVRTGLDNAAPIVSGLSSAAASLKTAAGPLVNAAVEKIKTYNEGSNQDTQVESVGASITAGVLSKNAIAQTADPTQVPAAVRAIVEEQDTAPVNETFAGSVTPNSNLMDTVTGILQTFSKPSISIGTISESAALYASEKFAALQNVVTELPSQIQSEVKKVLASPDFKRIQTRISNINLNVSHSADTEITPEVKATTVAVAKVNPANVNPDVVKRILEQDDRTDLTEETVGYMETAAEISTIINDRVGREVEISEEKVISLQARPGNKEVAKDKNQISRSILVSGLSGLRSVNDFAADIFKGVQAPNKKVVGKDGIAVPVESVAKQFGMFAQHLLNKVEALNQSYDGNNERGRGPSIGFTSLVGGREMRTPDMAGAAVPVAYHRDSEKSVEFAKTVHADAVAAVKVYNALVARFPDQFPGGKLAVPSLRGLNEPAQVIEQVEELEAEPEAKAETQDNTTAVEEEVSPSGETLTEAEPTDTKTLFDTINAYQDDIKSEPMLPRTKAKMRAKIDTILAHIGLPSGFVKEIGLLTVLDGGTTAGIAYWQEGVISLVADAIENLDEKINIKLMMHEVMHLVDYAAGINKTMASESSFAFDINDGEIYAEVKAAMVSPEWKKFFSYANSQTDPLVHASELFAEIGTIVLLNPEVALEKFPKGTAYVLEVIAKAGGKLELEASVSREATPANNDAGGSVQGIEAAGEADGQSQEVTLSQAFNDTFTQSKRKVDYTDADSVLDLVSQTPNTEAYVTFAKPLVKQLSAAMQARLAARLAKLGKTPEELSTLLRYKNMLLVDPTTGAYNERLLGLAALAVVDWLSAARGLGAGRLQDTLEELGLASFDLSVEDIQGIMNSVPVRQSAEAMAKDVLNLWNLKADPDASMEDIRGTTEGLVKELLTVLNDTTDLINLIEIKVDVGKDGAENATATAIEVSGMKESQDKIGIVGRNAVQKALRPEDTLMASIGTKIVGTDQTQSRGDVALSALEKRALTKMQDTAHFLSEGITNLVQTLGYENLRQILGHKDNSKLADKHPLKVSIEGKNLSIQRDYEEAMQMVAAVGDSSTPVFYPVGISKVGRHQMKGINPQNNKILRVMINPTKSVLNMTKKADQDAFWLTVAQASGLFKVENKLHSVILSKIQNDFNATYNEALNIIGSLLDGNDLDGVALVKAMGTADMAQLNAVYAVAELEFAKKNNKLEEFTTTLSFELDGKTDGPGNMMSNFGQGTLTVEDYMNFQRVGYFLGKKGMTLNAFYSDTDGNKLNVDLYETTSTRGDTRLFSEIAKANSGEKAVLYAARRFAGVFGDFKINGDGTITMTRNTAKNPMTKTVYGSGVKGVGTGIAQDMMLGFYAELVNLQDGVDLATHFNYPNIEADIAILFGEKLPEVLEVNNFVFKKSSQIKFEELVTKSIGTILSETAKSVVGDKITEVNDLLVFITGVQTQYIKALFEVKLAELVEKRAAEGKIGRNKQGKGIARQLSDRDYKDLVKELRAYSPIYSNGSQTLAVGSFSNQPSNITMSTTMDEKLRVLSTMAQPDIAGVKVIPYVSIGRGDAMMMNTIYGSENGPSDTLPVFDGVDMPISKIMAYASQINEAVLNNWDADVLGDILTDFEGFLAKVGSDPLLAEAFAATAKTSFKSSVVEKRAMVNTTQLVEGLREAVRLNRARKAVFKRISVSVDHMGGSGTSFTRNDNGKELSLDEINSMIQAELDGVPFEEAVVVEEVIPTVDVAEDETTALVVTDGLTILNAMEKETRKKHVRDTVRALKSLMGPDLKVVMGTLEQVQKHIDQNGTSATRLPNRKGMYDVETNTVYITDDNHETIAHELVHMATFQAVLAHYSGTDNQAVARLELLMGEFMDLDFTQSNKTLRDAYNSAKTQILRFQTDSTPFNKAAALNEFMAWTLSNEALMKELKATPTSVVAKLTKTVMALIKRVLGLDTIPADMYSNILFNTTIINQPPENSAGDNGGNNNGNGSGNGGGNTGGNGNNSNGQVTPPAHNFTNFWIDRIRDILEKTNDPKNADGKNKRDQIERYIAAAKDAVVKLDFGGFALSEYQKQTYMAIHVVLATEMRLDPQSLLAMGKMYKHVTNNLTPAMFGSGQAAQDRYSAVMELMGATKNDEGVTDAIATLLALSQTSTAFRNAMDQIPQPEAPDGVSVSSLNELLTSATGFLMNKAIGTIDMADQNVSDILDGLSASIITQDQEREFSMLKGLMGSIGAADKFMSGALSKLASTSQKLNVDLQNSTRSGLTKTVGGAVALATQFLDKDTSELGAKGTKDIFHMGGRLDWFIPFREFISEMVGNDKTNEEIVGLLDKTQFAVQAARQAYREELPVILQNEFETHPDKEQWKAAHRVLGRTDLSSIFDLKDPDDAMSLLTDQVRLERKIAEKEKTIRRNFSKVQADLIMEKSQQLADFNNDLGAGFQLWKNAYAIHKLSGGSKTAMVQEIDKLITLYTLNGVDQSQRDMVAEMHDKDAEAVHNLIVYLQGLNKEEDGKTISEAARMNGYKGYVPDHGSSETTLVIKDDNEREDLKRLGYTRVADYTAEDGFSAISRGYYITSTKQAGNYSQGVLQQVQDSYRGVNATTGLTVNGTVSGVISGVSVVDVTDELNKVLSVVDPKETLIPVFDDTGVAYYERSINPDLIAQYNQPESNLATMLGAWAGRQVEEKFAQQYNNELISKLKQIWDNRDPGDDGLFVDMSDKSLKDKIYRESWKVIPPQTKGHILAVFGEEGGFMVRRDMINLSLGYRDASIVDVWNGQTRLPAPVVEVVKAITKRFAGDKGMQILAKAEEITMTAVAEAKELIVVRSLVVPYMNTQANVFQLVTRGVPLKATAEGYKAKFAEIDKWNENDRAIIALDARIKLAGTDANRVAILKQQRQVLLDENKRMSIAPMIKAGAYKNISEGMTDLDVSLSSGKFGDWIQGQVAKLPPKAQTIVKYGLVSKDTALYKGANKAVQYGDFIAKSIYHDHLVAEGMDSQKAIKKVGEEFVNFSVLPGRMRGYMESIGGTWFLTFKVRSMKIAASTIRDNPLRALMVSQVSDGPVTDNLVGKALDGGLDYSLGWGMLFSAPAMNPWVEFMD